MNPKLIVLSMDAMVHEDIAYLSQKPNFQKLLGKRAEVERVCSVYRREATAICLKKGRSRCSWSTVRPSVKMFVFPLQNLWTLRLRLQLFSLSGYPKRTVNACWNC